MVCNPFTLFRYSKSFLSAQHIALTKHWSTKHITKLADKLLVAVKNTTYIDRRGMK